ncbi:MAG: hypothetical protein GF399_10780 [Candidatus Coatesbacteria bacterium]|nr:hypothetical protein [Candidatus Coatesbacteria bacterium]
MKTIMLISGTLLCVAPAAADLGPAQPAAFWFDSGGAHHPGGHGAWSLRLYETGDLELTHTVGEEITDWDDLRLDKETNTMLWERLYELNLDELEFAERPGVPDEVMLKIAFFPPYGGGDTVELWSGDVAEVPRLVELLELLEELIEEQTGRRAVLR